MANLPVREMVLYKHGVGFFVRGGEMSGSSVLLTFRADEINDVLKSLAVFDRAEGGQVLGIHYQTPMDKQKRLETSSIELSGDKSLADLILNLRGRHVVMTFETMPGRVDTVTGRVIGMDATHVELDMYDPLPIQMGEARITLLSGEGEIRIYPLESLRSFKIEDGQSEQDLHYFLDTSMSEDERRVVNVRLNDASHDLVVSYVAPSPTWRVSYRVVAESEEGGSTGKALLQGWGLFDNRLEEDLDNVKVTLVAGQPISFIYDLYSSQIPHRQTVKDEARTTGPIEFAAAAPPSPEPQMDYMAMERERGITASYDEESIVTSRSSKGVGGSFEDAFAMTELMALQSLQSPSQAEGKATGETFQYIVNTPVSVKRGESALVPIVSAEVEYERELLYNHTKFQNNPVAALRFTNSTGLTLERGPVTLVEDSTYKGEAIIEFTTDGNAVYLPYAIELGVNVKVDTDRAREHHALNIENGYLLEQWYTIIQTSYTIENTTDDAKTVTVEQALGSQDNLFQTREPDSETLNEKRWRVAVEAKSKTVFRVNKRYIQSQNHLLRDLKFEQIQRWADKRYLDQELFEELGELTKTLTFIQKTKDANYALRNEREEIYGRQEQFRANLGALQSTGKEATLRDRILAQLTASQDRLDEIEKALTLGERTINESEKRVEAIILSLTQG
ncbi:MAG: hypothetical protein AAF653_02225 [Chloroflexota bacterium]